MRGLDRDDVRRRFVPYNGAVGEGQLAWLRAELEEASACGDRVVIASHVPLVAEAASPETVVWNAEEVLSVLHDAGKGVVALVLSGHDHDGGFAVDAQGLPHLTLPSPMETPLPGAALAHATLHFFADRIVVAGRGRISTRVLDL